ncbi:hypothetical protein TNCV_4803171 [Trichonephila clavipes]|nr:hypothetical protein TNCV_4803171 [Trichonephila clavipes]
MPRYGTECHARSTEHVRLVRSRGGLRCLIIRAQACLIEQRSGNPVHRWRWLKQLLMRHNESRITTEEFRLSIERTPHSIIPGRSYIVDDSWRMLLIS